MNPERLRNYVAALIALIALGVISYIAVRSNDEAAKGALISVLSAATGWYLRGQVASPPETQPRRNPPSGGNP